MIEKLDLIKMKIFFLLSIIIIAIIFLLRKAFYSAKRSLFKDQAAWSNKDLKIKYNNSMEIIESNDNDNFLKIIADESKIYLDNQSKEEE